MNAFLRIATNVATPLALAGLISTILFFIVKQLLSSRLLRPVKSEHTFLILKSIIACLFWLSLASIIIRGVRPPTSNVLPPPPLPPQPTHHRIPPTHLPLSLLHPRPHT